MLIFLAVAVVIGLLPAAIAHQKGQDFVLWWLYGAALFIIALPHAILLKPDTQSLDKRRLAEGMKQCPECAELVKGEARRCRFCGYEFGDSVPAEEFVAVDAEGSLRPPERLSPGFFITAIVLAVFIVGVILAAVFDPRR
jgi:Uncharacterised protein family UPF0547